MTSLTPSQQAAAALVQRLRELLVSLPAGPVRNDVLLYAVQTERMVTELKALQARMEKCPRCLGEGRLHNALFPDMWKTCWVCHGSGQAQEAFPVPVELTGPGIESALSAMNRKYQEGQE